MSLLGEGHVYVENFKEKIKQGYQGTVNSGIGILKATKEDIAAGHLDKAPEQSPLLLIEQICIALSHERKGGKQDMASSACLNARTL